MLNDDYFGAGYIGYNPYAEANTQKLQNYTMINDLIQQQAPSSQTGDRLSAYGQNTGFYGEPSSQANLTSRTGAQAMYDSPLAGLSPQASQAVTGGTGGTYQPQRIGGPLNPEPGDGGSGGGGVG